MKKLMLGNEAVARGLYEAGCSYISSYPGTPSTEITESASKYPEIHCEWAPNEKVAMESAHGATLAGKRTACAMKHVGQNVAADPLFTISYIGVDNGMVICVADYPGLHSSQNEQDSRHYAIAAKLPMLEPSDSGECRDFAKIAYDLSEKYHTAVMLKLCTRISHAQSIVELGERAVPDSVPYEKKFSRVMLPVNAKKAHYAVEERMKALLEYAEETPLNRVEEGTDHSIGIITGSTCYQYTKEVFGDKYPVLKLGMSNPLPVKKIQDFAKIVDRVLVIEELDPIIEIHCKAIGVPVEGKSIFPMVDEFSQRVIRESMGITQPESAEADAVIPGRPPAMCSGCPHRGIFYLLKKHNLRVFGDIGCYTLGATPPLSAMDVSVCMGASLSGMHGFNKAAGTEMSKKSVGVIGDSTFMHSGMTGLADIAYNNSNSTVIILDNSITGMTGHQQNPTSGYDLYGNPATKIDLEALCRAMGIKRVRVIDPYNLAESEKAILEETEAEEPSVIIARRPCALLKTVKHNPPLHVEKDTCVGCRSCMKIGCPSLSFRDKKAVIDQTLCAGCGVCQELCPIGAIQE
ncbi:MAG: indolepyruvate ferredoxin oxidoreductase subunit alpha [Eubacteriales bacterium]|nr:indolepyruvate ferredoxin oxidoreductase subunit alpha [Eubacteriales bacterium]